MVPLLVSPLICLLLALYLKKSLLIRDLLELEMAVLDSPARSIRDLDVVALSKEALSVFSSEEFRRQQSTVILKDVVSVWTLLPCFLSNVSNSNMQSNSNMDSNSSMRRL